MRRIMSEVRKIVGHELIALGLWVLPRTEVMLPLYVAWKDYLDSQIPSLDEDTP